MAVATAKTRLTADDKNLQRGLNKSLASIRKYARRVKDTMLAVGKAIAVVGIAAGLLAFNFIKAASDFEEVRSKFAAVFKELTGDATTFVNRLSESLGRSKTDLTSFLATLQDTFVPLGFARREGFELSKTLTKLAIDLASFNNESEPDVIRSLQSAIVGNTETVRKYGVIITQATLDQEILNTGFTGGVKNASEQQKALARLNIILASTTDAQGDAKRTSGSFANQMRALNADIEDLRVEIGNELLPLARNMLMWLRDSIKNTEAWLDPLKRVGIRLALVGNVMRRLARVSPLGLAVFGVKTLRGDLKNLSDEWDLLRKQLEEPIKDPFEDFIDRINRATEFLQELKREEAEIAEARSRSREEFEKEKREREDLAKTLKPGLITLERPLRLIPADIPELPEDKEEEAIKQLEPDLRPRFESLEGAWERITAAASSKEQEPAKITADATEKIVEETRRLNKTTEKSQGFLEDMIETLGSIDGKLELQPAKFGQP